MPPQVARMLATVPRFWSIMAQLGIPIDRRSAGFPVIISARSRSLRLMDDATTLSACAIAEGIRPVAAATAASRHLSLRPVPLLQVTRPSHEGRITVCGGWRSVPDRLRSFAPRRSSVLRVRRACLITKPGRRRFTPVGAGRRRPRATTKRGLCGGQTLHRELSRKGRTRDAEYSAARSDFHL